MRRVRRVGELTLVETEHPGPGSAPAHAHANSSLCLVLEGGFVPGRCLTVDLGPDLSRRLESRGLCGSNGAIVMRRRASWLATRLYEEFVRGDAASGLAIEGLALTIVGHLTRVAVPRAQDDRTPPWLTAVLDILDERYLAPVRLSELAARVDVDPRHMSRVFRQRLGVTLTDYVRRRRIDWASDRLATTGLPLSRIAMEAGFTDQAHFARLFKRATGLTPRAFRVARAHAVAPTAGTASATMRCSAG